MHLATGRSRPNPIRSKTKQNALTRPAERSGRLLERISNDAPRGMTVRRQNPAYRPTCMLPNGHYDFLEIFAFLRFWVGLLRFLCKSFSIFLQRLPCSNEIRRNDECSLPFLKQSGVLILQLLICPAPGQKRSDFLNDIFCITKPIRRLVCPSSGMGDDMAALQLGLITASPAPLMGF